MECCHVHFPPRWRRTCFNCSAASSGSFSFSFLRPGPATPLAQWCSRFFSAWKFNPHNSTRNQCCPLVNVYITTENHHVWWVKIKDFYGHFQWQTGSLPGCQSTYPAIDGDPDPSTPLSGRFPPGSDSFVFDVPYGNPKKERPKSGTPGNVFSKYHQTIFNPLVSQFPAHLFADGYHIYTSEVLKCHPRMVGLSIWFHRSAPRSIGLGRLGKRCLLVLDTHG